MSYKLKKKHIYFLSVLDSILIFFLVGIFKFKGKEDRGGIFCNRTVILRIVVWNI